MLALFPHSSLIALVLAALGTAAAIVELSRAATALGLVDHPGERRDHAHPSPLVGGIAIFASLVLASVIVGLPPAAYLCAAAVLVAVGAIDDALEIRASVRLAAQALAAALMILLGGVELLNVGDLLGTGPIGLWVFIFPMTIFAAVGVINSTNMIDGMDGLAGLIVLIALAWYAAAAHLQELEGLLLMAMLHIAAVAAFLCFNLRSPRPARVFLGDAGSTLLGFALAWLAIDLTQGPGRSFPPICALWIVLLPLADCVSLMTRRIAAGRSPFSADSRHIHHYLRARGLSSHQTLGVLAGISAAFGAIGVLGWRLGIPQHVLFWTFFFLFFAYHFGIQKAWKSLEGGGRDLARMTARP